MSALTTFGVAQFPDLLPLRDSTGKAIGLFSDHGSWLGLVWGLAPLLEVRNLATGAIDSVDLDSPLRSARSFADRQEFSLLDGRTGVIGFLDADHFVIEIDGDEAPAVDCKLPYSITGSAGQWRITIGARASQLDPPVADWKEQNRARWDETFGAAFSAVPELDHPTSQVLLARSVTTLLWNWRAPVEGLPHHGVIPSPFAYRGYWAWDSWKHAYALAHFAPALAADQLRAQFLRQQSDGMVPDTVFPDASQDNWHNTKPPLAAWALLHLARVTGDTTVAAELYPKCALQMEWFMKARRVEGEVLFRPGGVDELTATWDTGWDECARFSGIGLERHGAWALMDLWPCDYNAYCYNEFVALAGLAELLGEDASRWQHEAARLGAAIQRGLWNEALHCFGDVRASDGANTGFRSAASWLPVWAGAADSYQKERVIEMLLDPRQFATTMPFPTLAASEKDFNPDGYWNGAVWADHAAYAFAVLGEAGTSLRARTRDHLAQRDALFECYSPLDGQPARGNRPAVSQFSWTAASGVAVLLGGPLAAGR